MILTNCAACAAPLAHDAPRCVRCKTRYCDATCQHDHWRRGHKQICKRIHRGGNAEHYHADKKYKEAVAEAVEACADDTKGQTCYICTQALHWKTKEGLVRGCACRGTAGFVHVSCLAEEAQILVAEAEENNWDHDRFMPRWEQWFTCSMCERRYHGVVLCALSWACWKTYLGRPEADGARMNAMTQLGFGLSKAGHHEEALSVQETLLATLRRTGAPEAHLLDVKGNIAATYHKLGRCKEALSATREIYAGVKSLYGGRHFRTLEAAFNLALALNRLGKYAESERVLRGPISDAQRTL